MLKAINPYTGDLIKSYPKLSTGDALNAIDNAQQQFLNWRHSDFTQRTKLMQQAAQILRERSEQYAHLMAQEMGKPLEQGRSEIEKCAWVCEYYAEQAANFLASETIETDTHKSLIAYQPLGVVLAVMPWNFPFWQCLRFAAPALMAGNAALLKHASNVPGCALAIEAVFVDAGFPPGLFKTLLIDSSQVEAMIEHKAIRAVTLTGSEPAGRAVAAKAGQEIKKTVLELGGSDAYLILADADLDLAAQTCCDSRLINSGQSCIGAKRFIVVESVAEAFTEKFVACMRDQVLGDPLNPKTTVGPLARPDLRDELHQQVCQSIEKGAKCLLGGKIRDQAGSLYPPTVLSNVKAGMPAYDEELFGPVAAIITVKDEAEAIRVANDSDFGLGAAIFSQDLERAEQIASTEIEAGACFVNSFVKSDPRLPFGGIKNSGYGRELSYFGIREFVNIKTVSIASGN